MLGLFSEKLSESKIHFFAKQISILGHSNEHSMYTAEQMYFCISD